MKLRLPSTLEGGVGIFAIIIIITTVELYFAKKLALSSKGKSSREDYSDTAECVRAGGHWMGDPDNPCCKNPKDKDYLPNWIETCDSDDDDDDDDDEPNAKLGCPDSCAFDFKYPKCEKCPQPRGEGGRGTSGGFL